MSACARLGCPNEGTAHPVLLAMPAKHPEYVGPPVEMVLGILVCQEHQAAVSAKDFVSDEGWAQLLGAYAAMGRAAPDRDSLGLAWKRPEFVVGVFDRKERS